MMIMLGETRDRKNLEIIQRNGWSRIFLKCKPNPFPFERWGFDNGAFGAFLRGSSFPESEFLRRLDASQTVTSDPYLAVVPDIVAGGERSLDFSLSWLSRLPREWPWYLAVQDGMATEQVGDVLHMFSGIFLGGSDRFKATAYRWRVLAHASGKKFHYGRAGTHRKLLAAWRAGSDSCDSSFPLWSRERMSQFCASWESRHDQHNLDFVNRSERYDSNQEVQGKEMGQDDCI
jgi:hypothetical protein